MQWLHPLLSSRAPAATVLIRLAVGWIFLSEGIQKFLFPVELGVGRFEHLGIPWPAYMAPFVGVVEVVCGLLILLGLFVRFAALPLLLDMLVAIATTKVPILLQHGFWSMAHEARVDISMFLALLFFLIVGAGPWSLDVLLVRRLVRTR